MADKSYLSVTDTAKLVRAALKKAFPAVKFSVRSRSYSGGASIDVGWTDGPTKKEVDAVIDGFSGSGFDGMQDLKYSYSHWLLPDGTTVVAQSFHNLDGGVRNEKPHPDATLVHFGADFIFANRSLSPALMKAAAADYFAAFGLDLDPDTAVTTSTYDGSGNWAPHLNGIRHGQDWLTTFLHRSLVGLRGDGTRTHDRNGFEIRNDDAETDRFADALTATIEGSVH